MSDSSGEQRIIFVTGGSGFVGSAVIDELLQKKFRVRALVHRAPIEKDGVESVPGGLFGGHLAEAMAGCAAVIHLVGIIMERGAATFEKIHVDGTKAVVDAAKQAGVGRYIHMSALSTRENAKSAYHRTKWDAEQHVVRHAPAWTIFRPSLIHGPGGEFTEQLAKWARGRAAPWVVMPYFGGGLLGTGGAGKLQPVHVDDVAKAFVGAIDLPAARGRIYNLAGPEVLTWPQMHRVASEAVRGKPKRSLPIPAWYAGLLTRVVPGSLLPFNRAQVQMSQEDNTGDVTEYLNDFGRVPRPFTSSFRDYAGQL
jgi:NADH dehydrogenase